ncbi:Uncharacterized protein SCF082_LOCUS44810, partial [Durusdinium trenchii]
PRGSRGPLYAWSEFSRVDAKNTQHVDVGTVISLDELGELERTRKYPTKPLYRGEVYNATGMRIEIERSKPSGLDHDEEEDDGLATEEDKEVMQLRSQDTVFMQFNRRKRGWNYSWAANKHTCDARHVLFVYVMVPHGKGKLRCVSVHASPEFQVFCRKRPQKDDEVAVSAPGEATAPASSAKRSTPRPGPARVHQQHQHKRQPQQQQHQQMAGKSTRRTSLADVGNLDHTRGVRRRRSSLGLASAVDQSNRDETPLHIASDADFFAFDTHQRALPSEHQRAEDNHSVTTAEDFRRFFIDAYWDDEGLFGIEDFQEPKRMRRNSSNSSQKQQVLAKIGEQLMEPFPGRLSDPELHSNEMSTELPAPPPLKKLLSREKAHREDPKPPKEVNPIFGQPVDSEEDYLNSKVWRLVLVLALLEAHWCESNNPPWQSAIPSNLKPVSFDPVSGNAGPSLSSSAQQRTAKPAKQAASPADHFPTMSADNRIVVQNLATFLIEENSFTKSIETTLSSMPPDSTMKELKRAFIRVAHHELGKFCEQYNLSLSQFDRLFEDQPSLTFLKQAAVRLKMLNDTMAHYNVKLKEEPAPSSGGAAALARPNIRAPSDLINCSGRYEMDEALLAAHEHFRELRGVPWVLRKMIRYIENTITIEQEGYERVHMQGSRKLLSNGGNLYITDGRLREFTLQSPVPWSKPLASYYKAWFDAPYLHVQHYYSETDRLSRIIHYQPYRLHFRVIFEKLDLVTNEWQIVDNRVGYANLVEKYPKFNADQRPSFPMY